MYSAAPYSIKICILLHPTEDVFTCLTGCNSVFRILQYNIEQTRHIQSFLGTLTESWLKRLLTLFRASSLDQYYLGRYRRFSTKLPSLIFLHKSAGITIKINQFSGKK